VDAPATIPDFAAGEPGPAASQAPAPVAPAPPAPASAPVPVPVVFRPDPSIQPAPPGGAVGPAAAAGSGAVPTAFRPDPAVRLDEDAARALAIETQRQIWMASIVQRVAAPAAQPSLLAEEPASPRPDAGKPEAA
jgi:hypothetical protein